MQKIFQLHKKTKFFLIALIYCPGDIIYYHVDNHVYFSVRGHKEHGEPRRAQRLHVVIFVFLHDLRGQRDEAINHP